MNGPLVPSRSAITLPVEDRSARGRVPVGDRVRPFLRLHRHLVGQVDAESERYAGLQVRREAMGESPVWRRKARAKLEAAVYPSALDISAIGVSDVVSHALALRILLAASSSAYVTPASANCLCRVRGLVPAASAAVWMPVYPSLNNDMTNCSAEDLKSVGTGWLPRRWPCCPGARPEP